MKKEAIFGYFLKSISIALALIMINTDIPIWGLCVAILLVMLPAFHFLFKSLNTYVVFIVIHTNIYNLVRTILYVIALIVTIAGKQDIVAVLFYIVIAVQSFNIIKELIFTIHSFFENRQKQEAPEEQYIEEAAPTFDDEIVVKNKNKPFANIEEMEKYEEEQEEKNRAINILREKRIAEEELKKAKESEKDILGTVFLLVVLVVITTVLIINGLK